MGSKPDSFTPYPRDDWRHGYASEEDVLKDLTLGLHRDQDTLDHHLPDQHAVGQAAWKAIAAYADHEERTLPDWVIDYLFDVAAKVAGRRRVGGDNRTHLRADLQLAGRDRAIAAERALLCYYQVEEWCGRYQGQSRQRAANRYARYVLKDRNLTPEAVISLYKRGKKIDDSLA